jgi:hypothetical protein
LCRQTDFDRFQGWQESRIYLGSGRLVGRSRPCLLNLFLEHSAQSLGLSGQMVGIAGHYKVIQPLVE